MNLALQKTPHGKFFPSVTAVKEVIRYLFDEVGLDVILCAHFLSNRQSGRVQEKCGFRHYAYGTYETHFGTVEDDETNILTKEDWLAASTWRRSEYE